MSHVTMIVDLGFGDSGKGTMVDFLTRDLSAHTVVRYNGGAQAAHNVVLPDGAHHTFAQFGSGTLRGAHTFMSRFMLVDPMTFFVEGEHLRELGHSDVYSRVAVDAKCLVVTPFHKAVNRIREQSRGAGRHGSCGMGIGEAMSDRLSGCESIYVSDLTNPSLLAEKLEIIQRRKYQQVESLLEQLSGGGIDGEILTSPLHLQNTTEVFDTFGGMVKIVDTSYLAAVLSDGAILFEGAQGVLLDEWWGFHPHTTWSTTTLANAEMLLREADYNGEVTRLGVIRSYQTRHGQGPLMTEDESLKSSLPEYHNGTGQWQGVFRVGYLDAVALQYALQAVGHLDGLAVTHLDYISRLPDQKIATAYYTHEAKPECFEFSGDKAVKIVGRHADLSHQEDLARELAKCEPSYVFSKPGCKSPADSYLDLIEAQLRVPVLVVSSGPTANDKRYRIAAK